MLRLLPEAVFHNFFSVSFHPDIGAAVVFHVVPAHAGAAQRLSALAAASNSLPELLAAITVLDRAGAGDKMLRLVEACCGPGLEAHSAPRAAEIAEELAALTPLDPGQAPVTQEQGLRDVVVADGEDLLRLANQLMTMGYLDFDFNMEVLQATGGDLSATLEILGPAGSV